MADFRSLMVWQKARALPLRTDVIAEGRGRTTDKDFAHYIAIAIGSSSEIENHLQRAFDLGLSLEQEHRELTADAVEVRKMLIGLKKRLAGQ